MTYPEGWHRREVVAVLAFTALGACLRVWGFGGLGLTHFDEGVYALSGLWAIVPGGLRSLDPMVIPYAPPGYPLAIGLAYLAFGVADLSAIAVSVACGTSTIPVAAWVGRRTFGPGAGASASAMAALSMAHVAFSRKALTDVPFLLAWLAAIGLGGRCLERPGLTRATAFGVAVGAAQLVKYNGWLAGVVVGLAAVAELWPMRASRERGTEGLSYLVRAGGWLVVSAAVALLVYWPWFRFVEHHGGYHELMRHHRSYLGGVRLWIPSWRQQLGQVVALSGGPAWGALTWSLAWLGASWSVRGGPPVGRGWVRWGVGLLGGAGTFAVVGSWPWWLGLVAAPWLLVQARAPARVLGAWWLLLSTLTPLYHPYARLWLPLHAAGWLLAAGLIARWDADFTKVGTWSDEPGPPARLRGRLGLSAGLALLAVAFAQQRLAAPRPFGFATLYEATSGLRDVVKDLPGVVPPSALGRSGLLVYGRRPLAFYLAVQGRYPIRLLAEASDPGGAWALIDGALLSPDDLARAETRWTEGRATRYTNALDPVTRLDIDPGAAFGEAGRRTIPIWLVQGSRAP